MTPTPTAPASGGRLTVYVSIGNRDDRLSQQDWAAYYREVNRALRAAASTVHGQWVSEPASAWQDACWRVELGTPVAPVLQEKLCVLARRYGQDSIAWAEVATLFLLGEEAPGGGPWAGQPVTAGQP